MAALLKLRIKFPSGSTYTISIDASEPIQVLQDLITTQDPNLQDNFEILVGYPPVPLVSSAETTIGNVLRNNEVLVLSKTKPAAAVGDHGDAAVASSSRTGATSRRTFCPPGIDEETWSALDEATRAELSMAFEDEDEDDDDDDYKVEEDEEEQDVHVGNRTNPNPFPSAFTQSEAGVRSGSGSVAASNNQPTKGRTGITFGARIATLSSNGSTSGTNSNNSYGPGSERRGFGARIGRLPQNSGG